MFNYTKKRAFKRSYLKTRKIFDIIEIIHHIFFKDKKKYNEIFIICDIITVSQFKNNA